MTKARRIGLISDTHGLLRPRALEAMQGCERIIHAGDVGDAEILEELGRIAPVEAVRGNTDVEEWARALPLTNVVAVDGLSAYVIHDIDRLEIDPAAAGFGVVVFGHSHRPLVEERNGVLFVNPGSAGPRRFDLPITAAIMHVLNGEARVELIELERR